MSHTTTSMDGHSAQELYCPQCGYDLRAIDSRRCPECGLEIDRTILGESIVPWLHRKKLGHFRAFWRTVSMATFRPRFLAREMSRPARLDDALLFRRLVVLHAWLPLAAMHVTGVALLLRTIGGNGGWLWVRDDPLGSILQIALLVVGCMCVWLFLMAVSGVASYFFHPRSMSIIRQNRAVALSYYGCAPLAYAPLTLACACAAILIVTTLPTNSVLFQAGVCLLGFAPLGTQVATAIRVPVVLLKAATHCRWGRAFAAAVCVVGAWVLLGHLLLVAAPTACAMIMLMIVTLAS